MDCLYTQYTPPNKKTDCTVANSSLKLWVGGYVRLGRSSLTKQRRVTELHGKYVQTTSKHAF